MPVVMRMILVGVLAVFLVSAPMLVFLVFTPVMQSVLETTVISFRAPVSAIPTFVSMMLVSGVFEYPNVTTFMRAVMMTVSPIVRAMVPLAPMVVVVTPRAHHLLVFQLGFFVLRGRHGRRNGGGREKGDEGEARHVR